MSNPNASNEKIPLIYTTTFDALWKRWTRRFTFVQLFRVSTRVQAPERQNHTKPRAMSLYMYKSVNGSISHQTSGCDPLSQSTHTYPMGRFSDLVYKDWTPGHIGCTSWNHVIAWGLCWFLSVDVSNHNTTNDNPINIYRSFWCPAWKR